MKLQQFIKEARERCAGATEGPWEANTQESMDCRVFSPSADLLLVRMDGHCGQDPENAKFIANARVDLPLALDIIEEQQKIIYLWKSYSKSKELEDTK